MVLRFTLRSAPTLISVKNLLLYFLAFCSSRRRKSRAGSSDLFNCGACPTAQRNLRNLCNLRINLSSPALRFKLCFIRVNSCPFAVENYGLLISNSATAYSGRRHREAPTSRLQSLRRRRRERSFSPAATACWASRI